MKTEHQNYQFIYKSYKDHEMCVYVLNIPGPGSKGTKLGNLVSFFRPGPPKQSQIISETAENRAPLSETSTGTGEGSSTEGRTTSHGSVTTSVCEGQATAGSDLGTQSFSPGHARSSSEPPCVGHARSSSQHSRISGYSTGHSVSSSVEGQRRYVLDRRIN